MIQRPQLEKGLVVQKQPIETIFVLLNLDLAHAEVAGHAIDRLLRAGGLPGVGQGDGQIVEGWRVGRPQIGFRNGNHDCLARFTVLQHAEGLTLSLHEYAMVRLAAVDVDGHSDLSVVHIRDDFQ